MSIINDYEIKLPRLGGSGDDKWKGKNLFDIRYWVLAALGKRRSGKSSLIYTLIKAFAGRSTIVYFFVTTFRKDPTYTAIREYLNSKDIPYHDFLSIEEEGVNNLNAVMKVFEEGEDEEKEEEEEEEIQVINVNKKKESEKKKKKPPPPEYMIIFDDISTELRNKAVLKLCKNSRHYRAKIILSSQSVTDLHPHVFSQLDYIAIFKNFNLEMLKQLYERIEPPVSFDEFVNYYRETTEKEDKRGLNPFLLFDRPNNQLRENLNIRIF